MASLNIAPVEPLTAARVEPLTAARVEPLTAARVEQLGLATSLAMSEQGAALEFAKLNGSRLAFIAEDRAWIAWTGTHWARAQAETLAEMFYSDMIAKICERAAQAGDKEREFQIARAQFLGKRGMRSNVLALAQPALAVSRSAFDRNAEDYLNTPSGIVNLRTGELTPCDPARYLTQCTAIAYVADVPPPTHFNEIVRALAGEDADTVAWIWRAIGYTLTGRVHEDAVFYLRGSGSNGKSTLLKALAGVLGSYAHKLDIRYLTAGAEQGHATEFAALRGKRLVFASEVEKGQRLAISRLKDLTGGDVQAPRDMYQSAARAAVFTPECKVWLAGNHDLAVHGNDHGTWRRLRKIESDKTFGHSSVRDSLLESEGPAILAAAVAAAIEWHARGLGDPPTRVAEATAAYRTAQDTLGKFFSDCLVFEPDASISKSDLTAAYKTWLEEEGGDFRVSPRELEQRLKERGVVPHRTKTQRVWKGVRASKPSDFLETQQAQATESGFAKKFRRP